MYSLGPISAGVKWRDQISADICRYLQISSAQIIISGHDVGDIVTSVTADIWSCRRYRHLMLRCRRRLFHRPPLLLHDGGGRGGGDVDHGSPYFSRGRKNSISVASHPSSPPPPRPSIPIIPPPPRARPFPQRSSEKACDACVAGGGWGGGGNADAKARRRGTRWRRRR